MDEGLVVRTQENSLRHDQSPRRNRVLTMAAANRILGFPKACGQACPADLTEEGHMGAVIRFPLEERMADGRRLGLSEPASIIILPVIRIEASYRRDFRVALDGLRGVRLARFDARAARSVAAGCGVSGLSMTHCATSVGCALAHSST